MRSSRRRRRGGPPFLAPNAGATYEVTGRTGTKPVAGAYEQGGQSACYPSRRHGKEKGGMRGLDALFVIKKRYITIMHAYSGLRDDSYEDVSSDSVAAETGVA